MALKKGLKQLLRANADIAAAVGGRVFVDRKPPATDDYPLIIFKYVASEHIITEQGINATQMRRLQFDCWGNHPAEADNLATAVHNLLDGYRGVLSEGTTIKGCFPTSDVDLTDEELQKSGLAVDFNIWFTPGEWIPGTPISFPEFDLDITDEDIEGSGDDGD